MIGPSQHSLKVMAKACWRCGSKSIRTEDGIARCLQCGREQKDGQRQRKSTLPPRRQF